MVFLIMNSIDILEELRMLMVIVAIFVGRPHKEAIEQRLHQAKGLMQQKIIGATDITQTWGQVCCSR